MAAKTLECVNMVKIDGKWVAQEEMKQEEFSGIMREIFTGGMKNIGFERVENHSNQSK